jgi:leucyl aminopeptidase
MSDALHHMTGYYNRYYGDIHGELSSEWLHEHIAEVFHLNACLKQDELT